MVQVLKRRCGVSWEATLDIDVASFLSFHVGVSVFYTARKAQGNEREEHVFPLPLFGDHCAERDIVSGKCLNQTPVCCSAAGVSPVCFRLVLLEASSPAPHLTQVSPSTWGSARDREGI